MSFVKLENLNDFIQPSTSCVKPIQKKSQGVVAKVDEINLSDCLACSGCITSAETILVQQQNYDELFKVINDNKCGHSKKQVIVSLSLQSIAILASKYSVSAQEIAERLASFFLSIGCHKVYDISLARHLYLAECYKEYKERKKNNLLPVISSACPGWICYVEKTNGELIIPYLSKVRSPQQIMGALIKHSLTRETASDIYHVSLMPCFDKKLEASRDDFAREVDGSRDVDCVLTPIEVEDIIQNEGVGLLDFDRRPLDVLTQSLTQLDKPLTNHKGSTSGGYAENLMRAEMDEKNEKFSEVNYTTVRNSDFIELRTTDDSASREVSSNAKFVVVNGFRNIQTIVQRLKRKALKYDYIEIMACPSGCINGGAQAKTKTPEERKRLVDRAVELYKQVECVDMSLYDEDLLRTVYEKLSVGDDTPLDGNFLYTDFRSVPKMQNLVVSW